MPREARKEPWPTGSGQGVVLKFPSKPSHSLLRLWASKPTDKSCTVANLKVPTMPNPARKLGIPG